MSITFPLYVFKKLELHFFFSLISQYDIVLNSIISHIIYFASFFKICFHRRLWVLVNKKTPYFIYFGKSSLPKKYKLKSDNFLLFIIE